MPHILIAESLHYDVLADMVKARSGTLHESWKEESINSKKFPKAVQELGSFAKGEHAECTKGYMSMRNPAGEAFQFLKCEGEWHFYYQPDITPQELETRIIGYDGLIVRPKEVSTQAILNADKLKLIVRGGAGVNSIDLKTARSKGITVENTPGQNSISTAEFTFGFIFELAAQRRIFLAHIDVMESNDKELLAIQPQAYTGHELYKQTLAVIGLGAIGSAVAERAKAFGMRVIAYSASFTPDHTDARVKKLGIEQASSFQEAVAEADIVTIHAPLIPETQGFIGSEQLGQMKDGAILINTARPQLIQPQALETAIASGRIGGCAIDGDPDLIAPFVTLAHTYPHTPLLLTPHIADSTEEAQINITRQCLLQIFTFFDEGRGVNVVV